jgi:hypothetical protein
MPLQTWKPFVLTLGRQPLPYRITEGLPVIRPQFVDCWRFGAISAHMSALLQSIGSSELFHCHGSRMRLAPVAHSVQQRPQRPSQRSNGVYHSRRRIRINGTLDDSGALQLAELLGERSLCDSACSPLQFGEPLGALEELLEDGGFPASAHNTCRGFYRTEFRTLSHNRTGYILYTTYRLSVTYSDVTMLPTLSSILTTVMSGLDM